MTDWKKRGKISRKKGHLEGGISGETMTKEEIGKKIEVKKNLIK